MTERTAGIDHDTALDAVEIRKILSEHHLPIRDVHYHARGMITGVQPLTMGSDEICTDTILAERIIYPNRDTLTRETGTLTLKKSAFSDFEPSMTPIPKYCFTSEAEPNCVLVHSVPRCTLDHILNWVEQRYPEPYPCNRLRFYRDWFKLIAERMRSFVPDTRFRLVRALPHLPKSVFPPPLHISLKQRECFSAYLLHGIRQHHTKSIFHDCITEKTVFFTGPYQPLFLANYAGVPASLLTDDLPRELIASSASDRYGRHFRDVYSLALICYRILTGERHDGRSFLLQSPRPTMAVLREIARNNELSICFKSFSTARHTFVALFGTVRDITGALLRLFSPSNFTAWRKLNRATGGLWRQLPLFGPLCDIYSPTVIAQALRCILDKNWVEYGRKSHDQEGCSGGEQGRSLSFLLSVFSVRRQISYPQFAEAFTALADDTDERRSAFGYVMELHSDPKQWFRSLIRLQLLLPVGITLIILLLGIVVVANRNRGNERPSAATTAEDGISATELVHSTTAAPERQVRQPVPKPSTDSGDSSTTADGITPLSAEKSALTEKSEQAAQKQAAVSRSVTRSKKTRAGPAASPPAGKLNPALGFKNVFVVIGVRDSCNPGDLLYPSTGNNRPAQLGQISPPMLKLYMARRSPNGFSPIHTIWLCSTGKCKKTFYYRSSGKGRTTRWAFARTGDAISGNRSELERFVQLRMSLMKK